GDGARSAVDRPAAQGDADVPLDVLGEPELAERGETAFGQGELDRTSGLDQFAAQVAPPFVEVHLPAAPGEIDGQERAAEAGTDEGDLGSGHGLRLRKVDRSPSRSGGLRTFPGARRAGILADGVG